MTCAACIAIAATLPAAGSTAEQIANENARLAAFTDVDAFSAIPFYQRLLSGDLTAVNGLASVNGLPALLALLGGDINSLLPDVGTDQAGYAALSAIDVFFGNDDGSGGVFTGGGIDSLKDYAALSAVPVFNNVLTATTPTGAIDALSGLDALSAVPVLIGTDGVFTGGGIDALSGLDALSAVPIFFGTDGVFTGGGIDALSGYSALSAVATFFGTNGVFTGGGLGALAPDANGDRGYAALSAIPAYLNIPAPATTMAAPLAASTAAPKTTLVQDPAPTTPPPTGSNPVKTFVASLPKLPDFTPPAPPKEDPTVGLADANPPSGDNNPSGDNKKPIVTSYSQKFTPKGIGDNPLLYGSGGNGVDNGISGWGSMLKKIGLGGGGDAGAGG
jgi:hypothetical protein